MRERIRERILNKLRQKMEVDDSRGENALDTHIEADREREAHFVSHRKSILII